MSPARPAAPALERAWLRALALDWHTFNAEQLGGALRPPVFEITEGGRALGAWRAEGRGLGLSRRLLLEQPWAAVREVLAHEMAHQYADEVLGARDEKAHGEAFRRACARLGVEARARRPADPGETEPRALRRVRKLLALAESPNEHEARLAASRAQRLMLEHNLAALDAPGTDAYACRQLGPIKARFQAHERMLSALLARHFFVQCVWMHGLDAHSGRRGRYLEISGTHENLEMASWVHAFLTDTGERLWAEHRRARRLTGDTERRRFLAGLLLGFGEQLAGSAAANRQEGLVWLGDRGLQRFFDLRHPRLVRRKNPGVRMTEAWSEGRAAGRALVLRRPLAAQPTSGIRLLEGR